MDRQPSPKRFAWISPAAEDLPGHEADPHGHAEPGQRPAALVHRERRRDQRQHLRDHDGAGEALQQARGDQFAGGLGQPAQQRGGGETDHAEHEHAPVAEQVAQPAPVAMPLAYMNA
jgi:hypothetical protein